MFSKYAYLDDLSSDKTNSTSPLLRWVVQHVVDIEPFLLGESLKIVAKKDVKLVYVGKDEIDNRLVSILPSTLDGFGDLKHWSDSTTASNHSNAAAHVWCVDESSLGSLDLHSVAHAQRCNVSRDVALWITLDEEIGVAGLLIA